MLVFNVLDILQFIGWQLGMLTLFIGFTLVSATVVIYRFNRLKLLNLSASTDVSLEDIETSIYQSELCVENLREGTKKQILWFDQHQKTQITILYIHGLSASAHEISPVPETIAKELKANLYSTRLTGHGSDGEFLASASAEDWLLDFEQCWNIATLIGHRVVIIASSTGATLVECFLNQLSKKDALMSLIYISPNFGIKHPLAAIMSWPFSQYWLKYFLGRTHKGSFENALQESIWTYNYPVRVFRQMQRLIDAMYRTRVFAIDLPVLVFLSELDEVVSAEKTRSYIQRKHLNCVYRFIEPKANTTNHVITGSAMRPETNELVIGNAIAHIKKLRSL